MSIYSHNFIENYDGMVGFGLDRETDEKTIICYLQMFSNDDLIKKMVERMSDDELETIFNILTGLLRNHLTEQEYHLLFLKDRG